MVERNPKLAGSNIHDCRPQTGTCPIGCNQCFYNRPNAFYCDIHKPNIPDPDKVGNGIVRMNCGHDSNLQREIVIETAKQYENFFFNTSIDKYDFPGPVVLTVNKNEEEFLTAIRPPSIIPPNLMFVRIRTSASNIYKARSLMADWTLRRVPVVITFMAYYDDVVYEDVLAHLHSSLYGIDACLYEYRTRHINKYWCPTKEMKMRTMKALDIEHNRLLTMCGTFDSDYCKDCRNCESYYWTTRRRLDAIKCI